MNLSVSFILPYYRVDGALLKRCLESLLALPATIDYEIILVDDGTPESRVSDWLSEWQMASRVRYIYQENKGPGGARNTGLSLAEKNYVQFVDPDDYLLSERYQVVWSLLEEKKPDLLAFDFQTVDDKKSFSDTKEDSFVWFEGSGTAFALQHNLRASVWGYLFRRSICQGVSFPEYAYHEDEAFTLLLYLRAQTVVATNLVLYAYYQRRGSIMNNTERGELHKRFTDLLRIQSLLASLSVSMPADQRKAMQRRVDQNYMSMLYKLFTDSPDRKFFQHYLYGMRQQGGYPLPLHLYTLKYFLFTCVTACSGMLFLLYILLRRKR